MISREELLEDARAWFDSGALFAQLARRVAQRTQSQDEADRTRLTAYLEKELGDTLRALGCTLRLLENPVPNAPPFLLAERIEDAQSLTLLTYAHGDVVRGYDDQWHDGRSPWRLTAEGDRWYGRGAADNKGQHTINLAALERVLAARGALGFNLRVLIEMGEEIGSPGLREVCERFRQELKSDLFVASDGPRLKADQPTLFLGSRGAFNFTLDVDLRASPHHSGNWGGLLANPGTILANAIACLVDGRGVIGAAGLRPPPIPDSVRAALSTIEVGEPGGPAIDANWGEPGLSAAERVFGWNSLEVLAFKTGNRESPVNAIPASASALLQLRFVVGTDPGGLEDAVREHLVANGLPMVTVRPAREAVFAATRLDPSDPWVGRIAASVANTVGKPPVILPNLGGSLPNDCFADVLGLPTVWIPHSYPGCAQHAPNEHLLASVAREGLAIMVGLFFDLGAPERLS